MIIKLLKILSCSSEHALYPSSNLLEHPPKSSWRCSKPNELMATVIIQLAEPSCITGIEIGNYRSCFIIVEASTFEKPDKWILIINHQFLSNDEAANSNFKDQVQLFTKWELNPETIKIKFDRVKLTCMQSANPREIFGIEFIILKTEVIVDLDLDVFGRFKLKKENFDKEDAFKEKYLKLYKNKETFKDNLRKEKNIWIAKNFIQAKNIVSNKINTVSDSNSTDYLICSMDRLKNQKDSIVNQNSVSIIQPLIETVKQHSIQKKKMSSKITTNNHTKSKIYNNNQEKCFLKSDKLCQLCNFLFKPTSLFIKVKQATKIIQPKKDFSKLCNDISFSLSGYVNPQRDEIRRKALIMGAKYIANPNLINNKCTHLVCCFKNTPKYKQLKGHCKIVSHKFIEDCFYEMKRFSWRHYALESKDQNQSESEEKIKDNILPIHLSTVYELDTDDSDSYC